MKYRTTDQIEEQERSTLFQHLLEYNSARFEDTNYQELGVFFESDDGTIAAGLTGSTHGQWLSVEYLWVRDDLRGQGIGGRILEQAEQEAKARGCKQVFLDTFDFQAPAFYQKKGYRQVFTLEDYPLTGKRYYLTKNL